MTIRKTLAALAVAAATVLALPHAAQASSTRWCVQGDPGVQVSARTSCGLAASALNTWVELYSGDIAAGRDYHRARITFNVTHGGRWYYPLRAVRRGPWVTITGPRGTWLRFYGAELAS